MKDNCVKLNSIALGLSMGLVYAIALFLMGLLATYYDHGYDLVELMASFYPGYDVGFIPSLIGALWGFFDGVIMGFLLGYFYNVINKCCCLCVCKGKGTDSNK